MNQKSISILGCGWLGLPLARQLIKLGYSVKGSTTSPEKIQILKGSQIDGYNREFRSHLDVGLEVLSGRADATPAIRPIVNLLDLDFVPLRWERYDLLVSKDRFFEEGVQRFLGLFHEPAFKKLTEGLDGYDLSLCGKIVFPQQ